MRLDTIAAQLRALAHPLRLRILHQLFRAQPAPIAAGDFVDALGAPQPTVSRHLGVLREAGLVVAEAAGTHRRYRLADVQGPLETALLAALEPLVAETPQVQTDARLTAHDQKATKTLPMRIDPEPERERRRNDAVFGALAHETRRRLLDVVGSNPGCTSSFAARHTGASRQAAGRHLRVLEDAALVESVKEGRVRRLYYNAVPLHLVYERWTDRVSAEIAQRLTALKRRVESASFPDGVPS